MLGFSVLVEERQQLSPNSSPWKSGALIQNRRSVCRSRLSLVGSTFIWNKNMIYITCIELHPISAWLLIQQVLNIEKAAFECGWPLLGQVRKYGLTEVWKCCPFHFIPFLPRFLKNSLVRTYLICDKVVKWLSSFPELLSGWVFSQKHNWGESEKYFMLW